MGALLLLVGLAGAEDAARAWETLYDARLVEALDGTPEVAVMYYEELLRDLKPGDPTYGEAWYALGRARWDLGNADGASTALRQAARDPGVRVAANALLARIDMASRAVRALPAHVTFEGSTGGFVRAGETADKGALEIRPVDNDPALAWNTQVDADEVDRVAVALEPGLALSEVSFRVRAARAPASLRVVVADGAEGRYASPVFQVPTDAWLPVELPLAAFRADLDGARGDAPRPLVVRVVELEDVTGRGGEDHGPNTLFVDDVTLR